MLTVRKSTELRHNQIYHVGIDQILGEFFAQLIFDRPRNDAPVDRVIAQGRSGGHPQTWRSTKAQPHSIGWRRWQINATTCHKTLEFDAELDGGTHVLHGLLDVGDFGGRLEEIGSGNAVDNAKEFFTSTTARCGPLRLKIKVKRIANYKSKDLLIS